jgi:hypothetical protein
LLSIFAQVIVTKSLGTELIAKIKRAPRLSNDIKYHVRKHDYAEGWAGTNLKELKASLAGEISNHIFVDRCEQKAQLLKAGDC